MNEKGNRYALSALRDKRAVLASEIVQLERQLRHRKESISHVDATLRLLDPSIETDAIPGQSRSTTLGLLHLAPTLPEDFEAAEAEYRKICPAYAPGAGMREYARLNWTLYRNRTATQQPETSDPDLDKARELVERFGQDIATAPDKAVTNLISGIVRALKDAGARES